MADSKWYVELWHVLVGATGMELRAAVEDTEITVDVVRLTHKERKGRDSEKYTLCEMVDQVDFSWDLRDVVPRGSHYLPVLRDPSGNCWLVDVVPLRYREGERWLGYGRVTAFEVCGHAPQREFRVELPSESAQRRARSSRAALTPMGNGRWVQQGGSFEVPTRPAEPERASFPDRPVRPGERAPTRALEQAELLIEKQGSELNRLRAEIERMDKVRATLRQDLVTADQRLEEVKAELRARNKQDALMYNDSIYMVDKGIHLAAIAVQQHNDTAGLLRDVAKVSDGDLARWAHDTRSVLDAVQAEAGRRTEVRHELEEKVDKVDDARAWENYHHQVREKVAARLRGSQATVYCETEESDEPGPWREGALEADV